MIADMFPNCGPSRSMFKCIRSTEGPAASRLSPLGPTTVGILYPHRASGWEVDLKRFFGQSLTTAQIQRLTQDLVVNKPLRRHILDYPLLSRKPDRLGNFPVFPPYYHSAPIAVMLVAAGHSQAA